MGIKDDFRDKSDFFPNFGRFQEVNIESQSLIPFWRGVRSFI